MEASKDMFKRIGELKLMLGPEVDVASKNVGEELIWDLLKIVAALEQA